MSAKARVLDVGNCDPDHYQIRMMLERHFTVEVDRVMFVQEALHRLRESAYALVLFNRLIFEDRSEGIALLRQARADPGIGPVPMMMISNYADAQAAAVQAGAVPGFGKATLHAPETIELLARHLPRRDRP